MEKPLDLNNASPEELLPYFKDDNGMGSRSTERKLNNLSGHPQSIKFYIDMDKVEKAGYDGIIAQLRSKGEGNEYVIFKRGQAKNLGEA